MRSRVITVAVVAVLGACGGTLDVGPVDRAVDLTGRDIRDTEYCAIHEGQCGVDPIARVRFKAAALISCPAASLIVTPRPDIHDTQLGHTHARDFRSWWPEGEVSRVRDTTDAGAVMEVRGCSRDVFFSCFRAHVVVREPPETHYEDPAALDCVRWAPWDPSP